VKCLAIDETPELIEQSLHELQIEINNTIPHIGMNAYLQSQLTVKGRTFVNSREFRLRFLRFELFHIQKSAIRMLKWLDKALYFFGSVALERPICISTDFSSQERKVFRKGYIQLMPERAFGTGRRILCVIPYDLEWYTESLKAAILKIMMYMSWIVGNDIDAQRKGFIIVNFFDSSFAQVQYHKGAGVIRPTDDWLMSVRVSAAHICTPDTPFFRFRRAVIAMAMGSHNRARLKLHLGTSVELRYKLQVYGIPIECIPLTFTGKIKLSYSSQWIRLRYMIEDKEKLTATTNYSSNNDNILVEAPYLNDALFKQGNSFTSHPGNNTLRTLIESKMKQHHHENANNYKPYALDQVERKALILHIIDEFENIYHGRFVNWHKSNTMSDYWWVILHNSNGNINDQKVIFNKVEPLFRRIHTKLQQQYQQLQQKVSVETKHIKQLDLFDQNIRMNNKSSNEIQSSNTNNNDSSMITMDDSPITISTTTVTTVTTINQNGGTYLFHSLDGNGKHINSTQGGLLSLHRQHDSINSNSNSNGNNDHSNNRVMTLLSSSSSLSSSCDISSSECFGMKFVPCYD
jgi:hypothetical protein